MRASRLVSLLLLLQTRGQLTAAELAAELEVSERTIHRDASTFSCAAATTVPRPSSAAGPGSPARNSASASSPVIPVRRVR